MLIVTAGPLFWGRPPLSCLPREERQEVVASLRESGLSIRAIAAATGDHYSTISRELGRVADATPDAEPIPITGTDGKTYKPKPADYFPVERLQRITAGWSIGPATPDCA
ncbi:helix-turn-helix domain-containing protein [Rhodococcus aetherivorans]|uniref:helix-turn-helix domain-containing protein n=1 Tax=Rhodococcus aetherivorans TaxID=191292 RepID=UPI0026EBC7BC|nr:helix-turn-helix domain-containing protein [Rhodococcus aetherivorans]WKX00724.1 helix-turn-helix domain-containing protein [Rhodococcus aetherivorans]